MAFRFKPRVYVHPDRIGPAKNRRNRLLVVHTSEGNETSTGAESINALMAQPGDRPGSSGMYGASYHYVADTDGGIFPAVQDDTFAYSAAGANWDGIHFCLPGKAGQSRAQWLDTNSLAMINVMAWAMRLKATQFNIPLRRLTVQQVRDGALGYCGHHDVSLAFGQSTHTDPGPNFPWDVLDFLLTSPPSPIGAPPMAHYAQRVRILNTTLGSGGLQPHVPRRVGILPIPPADWARVALVNITSVDPAEQGWLSSDGGQTSVLNFEKGQEVSNEVGIPVQQDAAGWFITLTANQWTHLVVEMVGWDSLI